MYLGGWSSERAYRVRTMSIGARIILATPAAPTATITLAIGFGLSSILMLPAGEPITKSVASGRSSMADSKLLVHVSIVFNNTLYTKVLFVPFHTPHTPSFDHNCESTSISESFLRSSIACKCEDGVAFECVDGVGVADNERLGNLLRLFDGEEGVS